MKYFTLFILLALALASCKKDEVNAKQTSVSASTVQRMVTGVNGPTSGLVNQELSYTLLWPNANTQNYFDHISTTAVANIMNIKLYAATDTTVVKADRQLSAVFKFKADAPGTYYLKFPKPGNDSTYSIIDTVTIK